MKMLKNLIGDLLGYARCPITNETYWHTKLVSVPYSHNAGILISARALAEHPKEQIAQRVFEFTRNRDAMEERKYSLEEIASKIPHGCWQIP